MKKIIASIALVLALFGLLGLNSGFAASNETGKKAEEQAAANCEALSAGSLGAFGSVDPMAGGWSSYYPPYENIGLPSVP
jgi:hypothetical protein